ncbi:peptidoglycan editing factor PgeF [Ornithinibacillus californiensis]|uniref:peptidoglycan editing factor PgeF n=1 Tax=Ornithinibacillus californiensis TaxID=161536 RepID=UPI002E81FF7A|nr:peptidoglycan editing factor PgeF [Ornithinibacillus californiensis]
MFQYDGKNILHIEKWKKIDSNIQVGFTSRNGGVSQKPFQSNNFGLHVNDQMLDVISNRQRLATMLNIPLESWVAGEQVHQTTIHTVKLGDAGKGSTSIESSLKGTDGLITQEEGMLCTAFFADCVPLFFFDPVKRYIGIAHAGWKGSVGKIAEKMTTKFMELGTDVKDLLVTIGPCISTEFYEVDEYVKERVPNEYQELVLIPVGNQHYLLDLKQLNVEILVQAGVFRSNIDVTNFCTYRDEDLFFSHRRDHGKTGRMLGFIGFSG